MFEFVKKIIKKKNPVIRFFKNNFLTFYFSFIFLKQKKTPSK